MNPQEPAPPKVFISYAWKNQSLAKQLQHDLQRDGVEVFVDYEKIKGGDSLPARISTALEWCNTLVLLWSADAAKSDWVAQEWENALQLKKRIIPCVLDGSELPALLRRLLYIDFSSYQIGYAQLCRALGMVPKVGSEKVAPPDETKSSLPPHTEVSAKEQKPPQGGKQASLPPTTKKAKSIAETLASIKPKRKQPLATKTTIGPIAKSPAPAWWRRGRLMNIILGITLVIMIVTIIYIAFQLPPPILNLRSKSYTLPVDSVKAMLVKYNFYDSTWNNNSVGIQHKYKPRRSLIIFGDAVVIDAITGLTWQQGGSDSLMTFKAAQDYIQQLNAEKYYGYINWRLPTLEEAMSLMEPEKKNGDLYIAPNFSKIQQRIWTADNYGTDQVWYVDFYFGKCTYSDIGRGHYVRAVRSEEKSIR